MGNLSVIERESNITLWSMVIAVSHYDLAPKKKYVFHSTKDDVASSSHLAIF